MDDLTARISAAVGSGFVAALAIWFLARWVLGWRSRNPGFWAAFAALGIGTWLGGKIWFPAQIWVGHAGAVAIVAGAMLLWVALDHLLFSSGLVRKSGIPIPTILRQVLGGLVLFGVLGGVLTWGYQQKVTGLLATSGVAALIIGLAMQDLLSNVIAGFSIHMSKAYKVGDWLLLGSEGKRAEVREINWRSTRLIDNDLVSFELPNSDLLKGRIVNLNHPGEEHAIRLRFGLDYDVPPNIAKEAILAAAREAQGVIESPAPNVFLADFADSAVIYELRVWMRQARLYNACCDDIRSRLWYELQRRGLRIPFPVRSIERRTTNVPDRVQNARGSALEILRQSPVLGCLDEAASAALVGEGRISLYGPGEQIVRKGEAGQSMFLILDGQVAVHGRNPGGQRVVLARLGKGQCFGEMSLLTGEPRSATVRSEQDSMLLEIDKNSLTPVMMAHPALAEKLAGLLEERIREQRENLEKSGAAWQSEQAARPTPQRTLASRIRAFFGDDD
ncbi:MAG: mechanosensitive ion channel family protein [Akkermansiaceae bacterium]|jgi:small-conductance mechanosensitive channel|nr:mechanosensitive ion channel family protein [Akkermansiaceae bacterium]